MKTLFITFEGIEASGKSTILNLMKDKMGSDFVFTREPGGTKISEDIRKILLDPNNENMSSRTEALLMAASRSQHVQDLIQPNLKENKNVICDRYVDSSFVYQGYCRDLGIKWIKTINETLMPDITFFFNLTPSEMVERLKKRNEKSADRLDKENITFHEKAYKGYHKIIKEDSKRFYFLDPNKKSEELVKEIISVIEKKRNEK